MAEIKDLGVCIFLIGLIPFLEGLVLSLKQSFKETAADDREGKNVLFPFKKKNSTYILLTQLQQK